MSVLLAPQPHPDSQPSIQPIPAQNVPCWAREEDRTPTAGVGASPTADDDTANLVC